MREILSGIFYVLRAGCAWRLLPKDFPPMTTVYGWFPRFRREGLFQTINHHLVMRGRERVGREASPSAAVIDSQSIKTAEAGGPRGFDAGKKIKGRKRHATVDTDGRALVLQVHPADIQDRDGAVPLLKASGYTEIFTMATDTTVRARIDERVKKEAAHQKSDRSYMIEEGAAV